MARPAVKSETGTPTIEHRRATRAGKFVLYGALAFLVISGFAAFAGFTAVASTSGGLCVALAVVGLLLHFEGERQKQRPDASQSRPAE